MALASARRFAEAEGLRGIGARKIARDIGYTIGTIYNVFDGLDDLILKLNCKTQDELYEAAKDTPMGEDPVENLRALAVKYVAFVEAHPKLWSVNFEFSFPDGGPPDWYKLRVKRLIGLVENAIAPLFPSGRERERLHHARVLWSSLHGIISLNVAGKMARSETIESMEDDLIENYIQGLKSR